MGVDNPFIAAFQNTVIFKDKTYIFKKLQQNWLLRRGDERIVVKYILELLNRDTIAQNLHLEAVAKLIDYNVYNEAKDYLEEASIHYQDTEKHGQIHFLLARCYHGLGLLDKAVKHLENALESYPNNNDIWNLYADCSLELGEWQVAVNCLNKSLRSSPRDVATIYRLGNIYLFYGEYDEALNCFSGCCKLKPFDSHYWEMKAEMLVKLNQIYAASECFNKAIKYGGNYHIFSRLAYCYAKTGYIKKSGKLLLKLLKIEPDNYDALCNLAGIYHKQSKNEQAYKLLKKAYLINTNDSLLLNNLGYICFKLGRSRKAVEYYNRALKINPSDKIVLYNLSICLAEKGIWEDARITLENLILIDNNNTSAWILLGNIYEQLSNHKLAIDCFNKSLGLA